MKKIKRSERRRIGEKHIIREEVKETCMKDCWWGIKVKTLYKCI